MSSSIDSKAVEAHALSKILRLLDALRDSPAGSIIYQQVEAMLADQLSSHGKLEQAYQSVVQALLDVMIRQTPGGSPLQVQLRLLRNRLQPPLSITELTAVQAFVESHGEQSLGEQKLDNDLLATAVRPLLAAFGIAEPDTVVADTRLPDVSHDAEIPLSMADNSFGSSDDKTENVPDTDISDYDAAAIAASASSGQEHEQSTVHDSDPYYDQENYEDEFRRYNRSGDADLDELQLGLTQQVFETITQNEEFGVLLEIVGSELRDMRDIKEVEKFRSVLVSEIEKLTKGHHQLAGKLDSTHKYLQVLESDSRQLSDELSRVRLLSLTDELTGLPNRRAFLRRLEDEVARVQRYGFPLSLALIDLDKFKEVNDQYGHAGGDEVLRVYSKNILSIFRHHDLVARYGGEEFAVLLANTDSEGAQRALNKVKKREMETRWLCEGKAVPVPTFSAGLALYKLGETTANFIERADKALYRAKRMGRNRVELDMTFTGEPAVTETEVDKKPEDN